MLIAVFSAYSLRTILNSKVIKKKKTENVESVALNRPGKWHIYSVRPGAALFYLSLERVWQTKQLPKSGASE